MVWQDIVISVASIVFSIALFPQVIHGFRKKRGFVTLTTSVPTFLGLYAITIAFYTMSLLFSSITSFITGSLWFLLFLQRLMYSKA